MPWYNGGYPPSHKDLIVKIRNKALEMAIAASVKRVKDGAEKEGIASSDNQDKPDKN